MVFVCGGSYKSFYLNFFKKIGKCDLLVFNFGIIYNYNIKEELLGKGVVSKELFMLSKALETVVVAGVYVEGKVLKKAIIICDGEKLNIVPACDGTRCFIGKTELVVGDEKLKTFGCNRIVLTSKRIKPMVEHCNYKHFYIFCDNFGVSLVKNKKLTRNFSKCSKIILK